MVSQAIGICFFIFLFVRFGFESLLASLNIASARKNRGRIPRILKPFIDKQTARRSAVYAIVRNRFAIFFEAFSAAFLAIVVVTGLFGVIDNLLAALQAGLYIQGILFIAIVTAAFKVFSLPFSLFSQFVIEKRFNFNTMTLGLYLLDSLKSLAISMVIGIPVVLGLFFLMDAMGGLWWLWAFVFFTAFQLLLSVIYPILIAPRFNRFTPLGEGALKKKIIVLLRVYGLKSRGIFVMDGSRRSRHSNAYFTGIGKVKRIVLFDTLVKTLDDDEICAVVAHELGHQRHGHVWKTIAVSIAGAALGFFVLGLLLHFEPLYLAFGFPAPSYHALLVLVGLCSGPFLFFLRPLFMAFSRRHEYQADRFAKEACGNDPGPQSRALIKLYRDNLSNLHPHPLYSFFNYSHPTLAERLEALNKKG